MEGVQEERRGEAEGGNEPPKKSGELAKAGALKGHKTKKSKQKRAKRRQKK